MKSYGWDDVVIEDERKPPLDYCCDQCSNVTFVRETREDADGETYDVDYARGGWLREQFFCENCLVKILGSPSNDCF